MIRPLRSRHRRTIVVLSGLVPLLFIAGLLARRPVPRMERVPGGTVVPAVDEATVISRSEVAWGDLPIRTTWSRDPVTSRPTLRLELLDELKRPDLLVYWSATSSETRLPDDSVLLGGIADGGVGRFSLPAVAEAGGVLLLYSLADAGIVASSDIPAEVAR